MLPMIPLQLCYHFVAYTVDVHRIVRNEIIIYEIKHMNTRFRQPLSSGQSRSVQYILTHPLFIYYDISPM